MEQSPITSTHSTSGTKSIGESPHPSGGRGKPRHRLWSILCLAAERFIDINATQRAAAFAYYAFFSLFPMVVLLVTIASAFLSRETAGKEVVSYFEKYVPISGDMQRYIFDTISGVIEARSQAGVVAFLVLVWSSLQFFTTLVTAANQAWKREPHHWLHLPLKSLGILGIMAGAVFCGIAVPVIGRLIQRVLLHDHEFHSWVYDWGSEIISLLLAFFSLGLFFKVAPRSKVRMNEIWGGAFVATLALRAAENLFVVYLRDFAKFNAIYGAFGGIMALLLWIYLSGCIVIFGACLCAARAEITREKVPNPLPGRDRESANRSQ